VKLDLDPRERRDLRLLLIGSGLNGFAASIGAYQDIIAKKALHAADWQIALLAMVWPAAIFFSIWWGQLIERTRRKALLFHLVALGGRLSLVLGLWITGFFHLLLILLLMYSFNGLLMPLQNSLLQSNFRPGLRGRAFGWMSSISTAVTLIASLGAGRLLDHHEAWFRQMFVLLGLLGYAGIVTLARIPFRPRPDREPCETFACRNLIWGPILRSIEVLKENREFARFELSFFIYGIGYIMLDAVMPHYLVTNLQIDYTTAFFGKGVLAQAGVLFLSPWAGKKLDKADPMLFTAVSMALIALYPLTLYASSWCPGIWAIRVTLLAYFFLGIAMAGMNVSWNISTIHFAGKNDVSMYQGVHVTLNSLRGLMAPFIGYSILSILGMRWVFAAVFGLFLTAMYVSGREYIAARRMRAWLVRVTRL
jgi:MFS family permease